MTYHSAFLKASEYLEFLIYNKRYKVIIHQQQDQIYTATKLSLDISEGKSWPSGGNDN